MSKSALKRFQEKKEKIITIEYDGEQLNFNIRRLTGTEMQNLLDLKRDYIDQWRQANPQPVFSGAKIPGQPDQRLPKQENTEEINAYNRHEEEFNKALNLWHDFQVLKLGFFEHNHKTAPDDQKEDYVIQGDTEEEQIQFAVDALGGLWGRLANEIFYFSWIQRSDVSNLLNSSYLQKLMDSLPSEKEAQKPQ